MAVDAGGRGSLWKRGSTGRLRYLSLGTAATAFVAEQDGRIRCGLKSSRIRETSAEGIHAEDEFSRRSRRARVPLAKPPVDGPGHEAGRKRDSGLGDRKAVKVMVTVRRSTGTKASTAALRPFSQRLLLPGDAFRATRLAVRSPRSGRGPDNCGASSRFNE